MHKIFCWCEFLHKRIHSGPEHPVGHGDHHAHRVKVPHLHVVV